MVTANWANITLPSDDIQVTLFLFFEVLEKKIIFVFFFQILDFHQVKFKDYNVLEDEELREGIKKYSDWPTIPQVWF